MKKLLQMFFILSVLVGCATGSSIVTGVKRPALDSSLVKIYLEPPANYEVIGIVEASSEVEISNQAAQNRTINELKKQAAKIGANGVILENTEEKSGNIYGSTSRGSFWATASRVKAAKGKAIYIIEE